MAASEVSQLRQKITLEYASNVAQLPHLLRASGFSDIRAQTEIIAVGSWGGRIGNLLAQDILAGLP